MRIRVQAQYLQSGDVVGSGETVAAITVNSTQWPTGKIYIALEKHGRIRGTFWGKYTMINAERTEK